MRLCNLGRHSGNTYEVCESSTFEFSDRTEVVHWKILEGMLFSKQITTRTGVNHLKKFYMQNVEVFCSAKNIGNITAHTSYKTWLQYLVQIYYI